MDSGESWVGQVCVELDVENAERWLCCVVVQDGRAEVSCYNKNKSLVGSISGQEFQQSMCLTVESPAAALSFIVQAVRDPDSNCRAVIQRSEVGTDALVFKVLKKVQSGGELPVGSIVLDYADDTQEFIRRLAKAWKDESGARQTLLESNLNLQKEISGYKSSLALAQNAFELASQEIIQKERKWIKGTANLLNVKKRKLEELLSTGIVGQSTSVNALDQSLNTKNTSTAYTEIVTQTETQKGTIQDVGCFSEGASSDATHPPPSPL